MIRGATPVSVLVVEDEVLISNLVADALSASGFLVHEVTTADEALEYIDSGAAIDVLFTDINLNIPWQRYNFNIGIDNLFDKRYEDVLNFTSPRRTILIGGRATALF